MPSLFDPDLRALRRDRAARAGPALFLHQRAFDDMVERLAIMNRRFARALIVGCPDPDWRTILTTVADEVVALDPGPLFAAALGGAAIREDALNLEPASFDLVVATGTLDTVDDLPGALLRLSFALRSGGLLIGAIAGGDTLPLLRSALLAAGRHEDGAQAHVHPRIAAAALAPLLEQAGLVRAVIDIDRVLVSYGSLRRLVADLRAMGATNILNARPRRPLSRRFLSRAEAAFAALGSDGKTRETIEIVHFAAWRPDDAAI